MKKLLLALAVMICFVACDPDEFDNFGLDPATDFSELMQPGNPNKFYSFASLQGDKDFGLHLIDPLAYPTYEEYHKVPGYSDKRYVIAIHDYNPGSSMLLFNGPHARVIDKLAEEYKNQGIEFAIIFYQTDLCSTNDCCTPTDKMSWVNELKNVKLYRAVSCTPNKDKQEYYYETTGVIAAALQRRKNYPTPLHFPHTFYVAHDKVYDYGEPRISSLYYNEAGEMHYPTTADLEADFSNTIHKNFQQFMSDADREK